MRGLAVYLLAGGLAFGGPAAARDPIKNVGFEKPRPLQSGYDVAPVGNHIPGWLMVGPQGGNIRLLPNTYTEEGGALHFKPHSGKQAVDPTGSFNQGAVGLQQRVRIVAGQSYTLKFWLGNQYEGAPNYPLPSSATLYVDGAAVNTYTTDMNKNDRVSWQQFSYQFTASSSHTVHQCDTGRR